MRSTLAFSALALHGSAVLPRGTRRRRTRVATLAFAVAIVLGAAYGLRESPGPGWIIRSELQAAAAELSWQIVAIPTEAVREAMRRHFHEAEVELDGVRSRPNVLVTLRGLSRVVCQAAVRDARRMEGTVVVALDRYHSPADCGERNDMTWWIMP